MVKKRSSGNTKPTYKEENGDLPWKFTHGMEKKKAYFPWSQTKLKAACADLQSSYSFWSDLTQQWKKNSDWDHFPARSTCARLHATGNARYCSASGGQDSTFWLWGASRLSSTSGLDKLCVQSRAPFIVFFCFSNHSDYIWKGGGQRETRYTITITTKQTYIHHTTPWYVWKVCEGHVVEAGSTCCKYIG